MMRRLGALLSFALLALFAPGDAAAQETELRRVVADVAAAWSGGDVGGVVAHFARDGVALELADGPMAPIGRRQAAALLRRLFEDVVTVEVRTVAAEVTGGAPARGFGELSWTIRGRGTDITGRSRVFLALEREDDRWRVTQVRLLR
ncbi:MAG: SgcJ/EcaC family oxidoreductase [Longimicrobiales bacterium]